MEDSKYPKDIFIHIDDAMVSITPQDSPSFTVRVHPRIGDTYYKQMTVVTEYKEREEIFISGMINNPLEILTREQWMEIKRTCFPTAKWVVWKRYKLGNSRLMRIPI